MDSSETDAPPVDQSLVDHVNHEVFDDTLDDIHGHVRRKEALANPTRYAILYYVYDETGGDTDATVPETDIRTQVDCSDPQFNHHLDALVDVNLLARIPGPERHETTLDAYRVTTLGCRAIAADLWAIHGVNPDTVLSESD